MTAPAGFFAPDERALIDRFIADGRVILPAEDVEALGRIRTAIAEVAASELSLAVPSDVDGFLNGIHHHVTAERLNAFRLAVINGINAQPWARAAYFATARRAVEWLVGNELAMQRNLNLSIQLPHDDSSLLPVHADVWSGDSPFEVVVWVPLVNCSGSKSMYLLPPAANARHQDRMAQIRSPEGLFQAIASDVEWMDMSYGQVMVFCQNLMHGNRVNTEAETRWSMNCRFKSVLSPYADKKLGEFFEPITLRPATRLGMSYRYPEGFDDE